MSDKKYMDILLKELDDVWSDKGSICFAGSSLSTLISELETLRAELLVKDKQCSYFEQSHLTALKEINDLHENHKKEIELLREVIFAYRNAYKVRSPFNVDYLNKALEKLTK